jgi:small subunit ribosomal protein S6
VKLADQASKHFLRSCTLPANVYEGLFILDSNRYGRDPDAVSNQIRAMIEKVGGEMLVTRLWEERRLAYPIKGQRKGTYWLTYFRLDSVRLLDVRRQCQITDDILRVLFLKVDPRIVDTLVAHATAAPVPAVAPAEEAKPPVAETEEVIPLVDAVEGVVDVEE